MDHDEFPELDQLLTRARTSAIASLDAAVDIEQRLRNIRRARGAEHDPDPDAPPCGDRNQR